MRREGFEGDGFGNGVCRRKEKDGSVRWWEDEMNRRGEGRTVDNERGEEGIATLQGRGRNASVRLPRCVSPANEDKRRSMAYGECSPIIPAG